jgi:hypothetical protein
MDHKFDIDKRPLANGVEGTPYADTLRLKERSQEARWEIRSGRLPGGITLRESGELSGTPWDSGKFEFDVRATRGDREKTAKFTLYVEGAEIAGTQVALDDVVEALLGRNGLLTADLEQTLDRQGNDNGVLDIGDLRAYLRALGRMPHEANGQ